MPWPMRPHSILVIKQSARICDGITSRALGAEEKRAEELRNADGTGAGSGEGTLEGSADAC
jgi:hypothetical protein